MVKLNFVRLENIFFILTSLKGGFSFVFKKLYILVLKNVENDQGIFLKKSKKIYDRLNIVPALGNLQL